ncbi:HpcH/HpaI aldolase family protein [Papillibacter cinnamivorans]|uniref:4-hydroxy-2-oxoheptanedioate aldolase n=1 Tax=Papillibacter cinnamivorans DSM 12816 TaxID=1122930 RepID=A0A1W2A109_9FIRM|nr:aldolase/citrate lyase family protein [Papillibacter cinnamivorans]SMC54330.1 4-hydroxy-2-oxoheptanedioate aldolase [Papillibacter cinnamivorans DSM 12816]
MKLRGQKTLKQRLNEGDVVFGTFYKFNCAPLVEMLALAGMDFIIVDGEHADYSYLDMQNMVRTANGCGMHAVVRVPHAAEEHILHAGDMGAQGIQVPNVKTVEEARRAAENMRYAPFGTRGLGLTTRASGYCFGSNDEYIQYVNNDLLSVIMVENKELAERVEELCDIPQLDVLFIGTGDMSQSCGVTGKTGDPKVQDIVRKVTETALRRGKKVGIYAGSTADVEKYIKLGIQYIGYSSEMVMIANKFRQEVQTLHEILDSARQSR